MNQVFAIGPCESIATAMNEANAALIDMTLAIKAATISVNLCAEHHAEMMRAFRPLLKLRAQHIAKARGKNWRNV